MPDRYMSRGVVTVVLSLGRFLSRPGTKDTRSFRGDGPAQLTCWQGTEGQRPDPAGKSEPGEARVLRISNRKAYRKLLC